MTRLTFEQFQLTRKVATEADKTRLGIVEDDDFPVAAVWLYADHYYISEQRNPERVDDTYVLETAEYGCQFSRNLPELEKALYNWAVEYDELRAPWENVSFELFTDMCIAVADGNTTKYVADLSWLKELERLDSNHEVWHKAHELADAIAKMLNSGIVEVE